MMAWYTPDSDHNHGKMGDEKKIAILHPVVALHPMYWS